MQGTRLMGMIYEWYIFHGRRASYVMRIYKQYQKLCPVFSLGFLHIYVFSMYTLENTFRISNSQGGTGMQLVELLPRSTRDQS